MVLTVELADCWVSVHTKSCTWCRCSGLLKSKTLQHFRHIEYISFKQPHCKVTGSNSRLYEWESLSNSLIIIHRPRVLERKCLKAHVFRRQRLYQFRSSYWEYKRWIDELVLLQCGRSTVFPIAGCDISATRVDTVAGHWNIWRHKWHVQLSVKFIIHLCSFLWACYTYCCCL